MIASALRRSALCLLVLLVTALPVSASGGKARGFNPGLQTLGLYFPERSMRFDAAVWYPTFRAPREFLLDGWKVVAARNSKVADGRFPVILLSHDTVAGRASVHGLAAALASRGFIVAAPTHPGDTIANASAMYRASLLAERPAHLLVTLEHLAASPVFRDHADVSRVGLVGVGAGTATVLQSIGLVPSLDDMEQYCAQVQDQDPFCSDFARERLASTRSEYANLVSRFGAGIFSPPPIIPWHIPSLHKPPLATTPVGLRSAAFLLPGRTALFAGSGPLTLPALVFSSKDDQLYPEAANLDYLRPLLAGPTEYHSVSGSSHFGLLSPCPETIRETHPGLCGRENADDSSLRQQRNALFSDFFSRTLGGPLLPEPSDAP